MGEISRNPGFEQDLNPPPASAEQAGVDATPEQAAQLGSLAVGDGEEMANSASASQESKQTNRPERREPPAQDYAEKYKAGGRTFINMGGPTVHVDVRHWNVYGNRKDS